VRARASALPRPVGFLAWWRRGFILLAFEFQRHRFVCGLVALIWTLALVRLFVDNTPWLPVLFNWTGSLPYRVAYVEYGSHAIARGDLIVYAFAGEAAKTDYPGLRKQPFFKMVAGVPGDRISVRGREVFVNDAFVGTAKTHTFDRRPLEPIAPTVIPPGYFYVMGTTVDSFDSRYRSSGLVDARAVIAKVRPVF
jgi:conjugal transfer pilin signal peptidase TrbI